MVCSAFINIGTVIFLFLLTERRYSQSFKLVPEFYMDYKVEGVFSYKSIFAEFGVIGSHEVILDKGIFIIGRF